MCNVDEVVVYGWIDDENGCIFVEVDVIWKDVVVVFVYCVLVSKRWGEDVYNMVINFVSFLNKVVRFNFCYDISIFIYV